MKISKTQLKQIIKEEYSRLVNEVEGADIAGEKRALRDLGFDPESQETSNEPQAEISGLQKQAKMDSFRNESAIKSFYELYSELAVKQTTKPEVLDPFRKAADLVNQSEIEFSMGKQEEARALFPKIQELVKQSRSKL